MEGLPALRAAAYTRARATGTGAHWCRRCRVAWFGG